MMTVALILWAGIAMILGQIQLVFYVNGKEGHNLFLGSFLIMVAIFMVALIRTSP